MMTKGSGWLMAARQCVCTLLKSLCESLTHRPDNLCRKKRKKNYLFFSTSPFVTRRVKKKSKRKDKKEHENNKNPSILRVTLCLRCRREETKNDDEIIPENGDAFEGVAIV